MGGTLEIVPVESGKGKAAEDFIGLPYLVYRGSDRWVPQFRVDMRSILARKHPFFEESTAAFFLARRNGRPVGTIAALDNARFNAWHKGKVGHFYFFDVFDDAEASHALFKAAFSWMRGRGLTSARGPIGIGIMGMGILVEGFEHRAAMTMMNYNHPYYAKLVEAEGFVKHKDQLSSYINARTFKLPDKVRRVAEIALARGNFTVPEYRSKKELARRANEIGQVYNQAFTSMGADYLPLSDREISQATEELVRIADPTLIKLLLYQGTIVGFLFGFPDLSAAIQRSRGRITPWGIVDLLLEYRRTNWLVVNGAGILPEYQRLGGNALLYYQLEKIAARKRFHHADATQIAETTEMMRSDLVTLGAKEYKRHRMYTKEL